MTPQIDLANDIDSLSIREKSRIIAEVMYKNSKAVKNSQVRFCKLSIPAATQKAFGDGFILSGDDYSLVKAALKKNKFKSVHIEKSESNPQGKFLGWQLPAFLPNPWRIDTKLEKEIRGGSPELLSPPELAKYSCFYCGQSFGEGETARKRFLEHRNNQVNCMGLLTCQNCNKSFKGEVALMQHANQMHYEVIANRIVDLLTEKPQGLSHEFIETKNLKLGFSLLNILNRMELDGRLIKFWQNDFNKDFWKLAIYAEPGEIMMQYQTADFPEVESDSNEVDWSNFNKRMQEKIEKRALDQLIKNHPKEFETIYNELISDYINQIVGSVNND